MKSVLFLSLILTLSSAIKVNDDGKSEAVKSSSTKAPYEEVEHSVINVTLPAQSSSSQEGSSSTSTASTVSVFSDSGVLLNVNKDSESEKSNVKPRKGVSFEPSSTTEISSNKTNTNTTNDVNATPSVDKTNKLYKVSEKVNDIENKNPPQLLNENSTILASVLNFHPINGNAVRGEVTEVTAAPTKEKPKKPLHTVSAVDDPSIEKYASKPHPHIPSISTHVVEEPVPAMSQELISDDQPSFDGYFGYIVISAVVLVFIAVPIVFGRKIKDHWNTRHYRRVDFLVDGMYND